MLHGGRDRSELPTSPTQLAYLRMFDMYGGLRQASTHAAVYLLRFRLRGWNSSLPGRTRPDPVTDALAALDLLQARHAAAPVAIVGHSMGGRTAFAVAGHPSVVGVCGLAPWLPPGEPLPTALADRMFVLAHGSADRMTSPPASLEYAERLRAAGATVMRFVQPGGTHAMLRAAGDWRRLAVSVPLGMVGDAAMPGVVDEAFRDPSRASLEVPLDRLR